MMNLHFKVVLNSSDGMLRGVVESYILCLPLYYLGRRVVTWLGDEDGSKIARCDMCEIDDL